MCAILQGWTFFARPTRSKRSRKKCAKRAQIGAKKCKRAQIQKTLPLNSKGLLTHVYLCLSEHPDTICREKCKTTAHKNLWRADFSKRNTFSFTSVNVRFRAETQRHVNLRYFGGPRLNPTFPYFSLRWTSYNFLGFSMLTHHFSWWNRHKIIHFLGKKNSVNSPFLGLEVPSAAWPQAAMVTT